MSDNPIDRRVTGPAGHETASASSDVVHKFKNLIGIIIAYTELLSAELVADDPRRQDIEEMRKAGEEALALLPRVLKAVGASGGSHGAD
jgi:signal transduction histidine kinase